MLTYLRANPDTRRGYAAQALAPFFGGMMISQITATVMRRYKTKRKVSPGTQARELAVFSAAIAWCNKELDWQLNNPVHGRMPPQTPHRLRWITHQQAADLQDAVGVRVPYLRDFITLGLNTGMRMGEMLKLEWSRVDLNEGVIYLSPKDQKDRRYGSVPINSQAREALLSRARFRADHCPDAKSVFVRRDGTRIASVKKGFAAACKKAGLENFHIHDLRHTCAAWLVQAGVPLRTVAEILRHKDIRTTMRYAHLAPDDARSGVAALETAMQRSKNVVTDGKKVAKSVNN